MCSCNEHRICVFYESIIKLTWWRYLMHEYSGDECKMHIGLQGEALGRIRNALPSLFFQKPVLQRRNIGWTICLCILFTLTGVLLPKWACIWSSLVEPALQHAASGQRAHGHTCRDCSGLGACKTTCTWLGTCTALPGFLFLGHTHTHQTRTPKANRMHAFTWQHARMTSKKHWLLR